MSVSQLPRTTPPKDLILPERSQILSQELLYTAITRARKSFDVWGSIECLSEGVQKRTERMTGLSDLLVADTYGTR